MLNPPMACVCLGIQQSITAPYTHSRPDHPSPYMQGSSQGSRFTPVFGLMKTSNTSQHFHVGDHGRWGRGGHDGDIHLPPSLRKATQEGDKISQTFLYSLWHKREKRLHFGGVY